MNVLITPGPISGTVAVPPSKSQTHRAIIAASLAKGKSVIHNAAVNDDIAATIAAMAKIGVKIINNGTQLIVNGVSRVIIGDDNFIDCNESGSTLRFVLPVLSLSREKVIYTGKPGLLKRPISAYDEICRQNGLNYQQNEKSIIVSGTLTPGVYYVPGSVSSQFISGLLFALPLLKGDSEVRVGEPLESRGYVDMTVDVLRRFGIEIEDRGSSYFIRGNQSYNPTNITIEGDHSQMAFFAAAGVLSGDVLCKNISAASLQPDRRILDVIAAMNGIIEQQEAGILFRKSELRGCVVDVSQCPDIAPIIAVMGAAATGVTTIENASRLKYKESNRLQTTTDILRSFGVEVEMTDTSLLIRGRTAFEGGLIDPAPDHRIVMSAAIAATRATKPVLIKRAEAVNKSYPNFFNDFKSVGGIFTVMEE
ncbi:MAG TPA: 3-phosphoshikimate 1-carboxyvinyltransferase [Acholeplasmatales bacterium]|nr:3-phosphoshikimate 1-carboxyvinyltransferase [Acholeplasmatales bacterium]